MGTNVYIIVFVLNVLSKCLALLFVLFPAIVSAMEEGVPKTIMFLNRGDSFGDIALLNNARRETTVISREKIELLVMSDEVGSFIWFMFVFVFFFLIHAIL